MGPLRNANATRLLASAANSESNVIFRLGIGVSQTRNHTQTNGARPAEPHAKAAPGQFEGTVPQNLRPGVVLRRRIILKNEAKYGETYSMVGR